MVLGEAMSEAVDDHRASTHFDVLTSAPIVWGVVGVDSSTLLKQVEMPETACPY